MNAIKNLCADCAHNLSSSGLDCEFYCYGATQVKTDAEGVTYVTKCDDYEKEITP